MHSEAPENVHINVLLFKKKQKKKKNYKKNIHGCHLEYQTAQTFSGIYFFFQQVESVQNLAAEASA